MNLNLEENLMASLIRYPDSFVYTSGLHPLAFSNSGLRLIFETAQELFTTGEPISQVTIYNANKNINTDLMVSLSDIVPSKVNIPNYVSELKKTYQKSVVANKLQTIVAGMGKNPLNLTLEELNDLVACETIQDTKKPQIKHVMERFDKVQDFYSKNGLGFETGFDFFEKKQVYYQANHFIIIGAFTSTGKTSLMIEMLSRVDNKANTVVISTEMDESQNIARMIARETGWSTKYILSGRIQDHHKKQHDQVKSKIAERSILLYDYHHKLENIEAIIKKASMQGKGDVFFIDYAQNIDSSGTEYEKTDRLAKRMQIVAKQCKCTIILFSQLSNEAAKDDDILAFKGAGTLAACCDVGIILKKSTKDHRRIQMRIRKNRHGPLGNQALEFKNDFTRLEEVDNEANM